MSLESEFLDIDDLNPDWPPRTDPVEEGADHLRGIKSALKANVTGTTAETRLQGGGVGDAFVVGDRLAQLLGLLLGIDGSGTPGEPVRVQLLGSTGGLEIAVGATGDISMAQLDSEGVPEATRVFLERDGPGIAAAGTSVYADVAEGAASATLAQRINFSTVSAIVAAVGSVVMQGSWGQWLSAAQGVVGISAGGQEVVRVLPSALVLRLPGSVDVSMAAYNQGQGGLQMRTTEFGSRLLEVLTAGGSIQASAVKLEGTPILNTHAQVADSANNWRPIGFNVLPYTALSGTHTPVDDWSGQRYSFTAAGVVQLTETAAVGCIVTFTNAHTAAIPINQSGSSGVIRWFSGNGMVVGNRSLAPGGVMTAHKSTATEWHVWGAGIS